MNHSKPYILDMKRPGNTEKILAERLDEVLRALKEEGYELKDIIIGFFDESSPQLSPNTVRPDALAEWYGVRTDETEECRSKE